MTEEPDDNVRLVNINLGNPFETRDSQLFFIGLGWSLAATVALELAPEDLDTMAQRIVGGFAEKDDSERFKAGVSDSKVLMSAAMAHNTNKLEAIIGSIQEFYADDSMFMQDVRAGWGISEDLVQEAQTLLNTHAETAPGDDTGVATTTVETKH